MVSIPLAVFTLSDRSGLLILLGPFYGARSAFNPPYVRPLSQSSGPCRVLDSEGPKFHKEAWNTNANLFFIDQPIGVGFSYAEYGETVVSPRAVPELLVV